MQEVLQARINALAEKLTQMHHTNGDWAKREIFAPETPRGSQKYIRIVHDYGHGGRSVHCFIALETGGVHKSAGWTSPARDRSGKVYPAKYNLLDDASFEALMYNCDTYGSYLYADYKIKNPVSAIVVGGVIS